MQYLEIEYKTLRKITREVYQFVKEECGVDYYKCHKKSKVGLEDDLGITGDDGYELVEKFSEIFNVNVDNFDYLIYFDPEPGPVDYFFSLIFIIVFLVIWLAKHLVALLLYPFSRKLSQKILADEISSSKLSQEPLAYNPQKRQKELTVGDLIASAVKGEFVERSNVKFICQ
jgi:hypothetical protein